MRKWLSSFFGRVNNFQKQVWLFYKMKTYVMLSYDRKNTVKDEKILQKEITAVMLHETSHQYMWKVKFLDLTTAETSLLKFVATKWYEIKG